MVEGDYQSEVRLRFESEDKARVLMDCLGVDEELHHKISRTFDVETSAEGAVLVVKFVSTESRVLQVAMSSFLDMAIVSCKTMLEFA
jgi:hypothetical protein